MAPGRWREQHTEGRLKAATSSRCQNRNSPARYLDVPREWNVDELWRSTDTWVSGAQGAAYANGQRLGTATAPFRPRVTPRGFGSMPKSLSIASASALDLG
jgi:hypothetical protein